MKDRMIISKTFQSMRQAENYQDSLYDKYDRVRLIEFPMFSEYGMYKWEVM